MMTSPYDPRSSGKPERFHPSLMDQAIRPLALLGVEEAKWTAGGLIENHNTTRLPSAIGLMAPKDRLEGHHQLIHTTRNPNRTTPAVTSPNTFLRTFTLNRDTSSIGSLLG